MMRVLVAVLALGGCGILPRTSTGDDVLDAVVTRVDPLGDCVTVLTPLTIFADRQPNSFPGSYLPESFLDPDVRAAASAIAVPSKGYRWDEKTLEHHGKGSPERCTMAVSKPTLSGDFAFVWYSDPSGPIGHYVLRKSGTSWRVVEHQVTGAW